MLIDDGVNGYLFKAGDDKELSRKLRTMIQDEDMCKSMGKSLYKKAGENFSLKNLAMDHINIYNAMLKNRKERNTYEDNR